MVQETEDGCQQDRLLHEEYGLGSGIGCRGKKVNQPFGKKNTCEEAEGLESVKKCWHFAMASDKRKLERIQERPLRVIYLDKTSSYEDLLKRANLDTLNERRLKDILFLMYKVKHRKTLSKEII